MFKSALELNRRSVLVVDDDASYRVALDVGLKGAGFNVHLASDARTALISFAQMKPDIILLDLLLPDKSGSEVCREIRSDSDVPIIMLSAVNEELDIVLCFELGADDYVPKPFRLRELVARMDVTIRRRERTRTVEGLRDKVPRVIDVGPYHIDFIARSVEMNNKYVELSRKEFDLLAYLALASGRVCSREELMNQVWGFEKSENRTLDTHMYRLRSKLEVDPARPVWIVTVRGLGFLLREVESATDIAIGPQPKRPLT